MSSLTFHAGPAALARIRDHGLQAADIGIVPAAAGGPKGLIFQALDQFVFGSWLPAAPRERTLIGSSIGAWRMAAACQRDPVAAFARLGHLYANQRYTAKPSQREIDDVCRDLLANFIGGREHEILNHPYYRLHLITNRGIGALAGPAGKNAEMRGFAAAALRNLTGRRALARMVERVVLGDARGGAAFARLGHLYANQRYTAKPSQREIDDVCRDLLANFIGGREHEILNHPYYRLHLITNRGIGALAGPVGKNAEMRGFAAAALRNLTGRRALARMVERVVLGDARGGAAWLHAPFDDFTTHFASLDADNLAPALLASGSLPLIMQPVRDLPGAPPGHYWDGGIIDYHLALPYARRAKDLVLYPHFGEHIVPGWLDKSLPWRRAARGPQRAWLDNLLIVAPSRQFLQTLPRAKLPDRKDFTFHGLDHDARIAAWQRAIGEGARLRDDFAAFVERPDSFVVKAL